MTLTTENWEGVRANLSTIAAPDWGQVEAALRALDQKKHTQVLLENGETSNMSIGGGHGRYHVSVSTEGDMFFVIDNKSGRSDKEQLVVGGQIGRYPSQNIVDIETALRAARTYLESGQLDASVTWVNH